MDVWTATCWPPYDYHYGVYDKIHPFRQGYPYQQYPVYRVPPVYHPARTSSITEQYAYSKSGVTTPPRHAPEFLPLDGSSSWRRQQRCQVSPGGQKTARGKEEETGRGAPDGGETDGGVRRDSTPDSPSSDQADARSYCRVLTFQDQNGQLREMVFPKALDLDRPKRARTSFTSYQLERLEREFKCNQYMVGRDRARLASNLDLTETQVKVWFQNRRTKFKREQCRAAELQEKNAESIAACNILRLLQDKQRDATIGPISPVQSRLTSW